MNNWLIWIKKYSVVLSGIFLLSASAAQAMHIDTRPGRAKILLIGVNHIDPSQFLAQAKLLRAFSSNKMSVILTKEGVHTDIANDFEIMCKNTQAIKEMAAVNKALANIVPAPSCDRTTIKINMDHVLSSTDKVIQIKMVLEKLNNEGVFQSKNGRNMISLIEDYLPNFVNFALVDDLSLACPPEFMVSKAKIEIYELLEKNNIKLISLEDDEKELNAYKCCRIFSDNLDDIANQPVIDIYERLEKNRTDAMAKVLHEQYSLNQDLDTVIMSFGLGLFHAKRVAAKLLQKGISADAIQVVYLNQQDEGLTIEEEFPIVFKKLSEELSFDSEISNYFKQINLKRVTTVLSCNSSGELQLTDAYGLVDCVRFIFGQNCCGNSKCQNSDAIGETLNRCARCKSIRYCSRRCQAEHWPQHKLKCQNNG